MSGIKLGCQSVSEMNDPRPSRVLLSTVPETCHRTTRKRKATSFNKKKKKSGKKLSLNKLQQVVVVSSGGRQAMKPQTRRHWGHSLLSRVQLFVARVVWVPRR